MTLIADMPVATPQAGRAFATPTIIHFAAVLLLSAVSSVPWQGLVVIAVLWGIVGLSGVVYAVVVARRLHIQTVYQPDFEDRLFHVLLPFAAYALLVVSAYAARHHAREALLGVGAAMLLLLFIGIHNAWDAVTYHVFVTRRRHEGEKASPRG